MLLVSSSKSIFVVAVVVVVFGLFIHRFRFVIVFFTGFMSNSLILLLHMRCIHALCVFRLESVKNANTRYFHNYQRAEEDKENQNEANVDATRKHTCGTYIL